MEGLVQSIQKLSDGEENFKKLQKKFDDKAVPKMLKKNAGMLSQVLLQIDPAEMSYGYCKILVHRAGIELKNLNEFLDQASRLMLEGDGYQLRQAAADFAIICRKYVQLLQLTDGWATGVLPLQRAVEKIRGRNVNLLTAAHSSFLLVCLKAKHYNRAMRIVNTPVLEVDPEDNGLTPLDYLQYFYYGGMICAGCRKFSQAMDMFNMALTIPSLVLSAVRVESYKKYVLCSLLAQGELVPLPNFTSSVVQRNVERLAVSYVELSRAFKKGSVDSVQKVVDDSAEVWIKDGNLGLVKQVVQALTRLNIQRLTNTYVTLSLQDIADQARLGSAKEAERHVRTMIANGEIYAKISLKDGMISFLEVPEEFDTTAMVEAIDGKIQEVMFIASKMKDVDRQVRTNPQYLKKTMPKERDPKGGAGGEDFEMKMAMEASRAMMGQP